MLLLETLTNVAKSDYLWLVYVFLVDEESCHVYGVL